MQRFTALVAVGVLSAFAFFASPQAVVAAAAPTVASIIEGRDAQGTRPVLFVVGKGLSKFKSFTLSKPDTSDAGPVDLVFRSATQIGLGLPATLAPGSYTLGLRFSAIGVQTYPVNVTAGAFLRLAGGDTMTGRLAVSSNDGVVFTGTGGSGTIPATGVTDSLFMWYQGKGALRAGVPGYLGAWDDPNIGVFSAAFGAGTTASGTESTAMGSSTRASGDTSTAMGLFTEASGNQCTAMGDSSRARGSRSTAMGSSTTADGATSTAMGSSTTASGTVSTAMGLQTTAQAYASLALGRYNTLAGNLTSWVSTDPVLVVGNGTSTSSPSNALTLLKDGSMTIAGNLTQNSDVRLKTDVVQLPDVLARLDGIRGVAYRFKDEQSGPGGRQIGLIAQEVRESFPELVHEDPDGKLSVAYGNFTAVLLEAVKAQQQEIAERDRKTAALEARVARLEKLLERALDAQPPKKE